MADYSIMSDVTSHIVKILREGMCPDPISSPNLVTAVSPSEQDADYILGVYLYDITEDGEISGPSMVKYGRSQIRRPPRPYSLYYMLYVNGSSQLGIKSPDTHKILGRGKTKVKIKKCDKKEGVIPWENLSAL